MTLGRLQGDSGMTLGMLSIIIRAWTQSRRGNTIEERKYNRREEIQCTWQSIHGKASLAKHIWQRAHGKSHMAKRT